jgi:hypothetical protein
MATCSSAAIQRPPSRRGSGSSGPDGARGGGLPVAQRRQLFVSCGSPGRASLLVARHRRNLCRAPSSFFPKAPSSLMLLLPTKILSMRHLSLLAATAAGAVPLLQ